MKYILTLDGVTIEEYRDSAKLYVKFKALKAMGLKPVVLTEKVQKDLPLPKGAG